MKIRIIVTSSNHHFINTKKNHNKLEKILNLNKYFVKKILKCLKFLISLFQNNNTNNREKIKNQINKKLKNSQKYWIINIRNIKNVDIKNVNNFIFSL